ncbi:MAG: DUF1616 domain-containing protein [Chloroflexi bacterium]|nr:DUF1616 domain-containing protein [Chloroflexota bacterium]
MGGGRLVTEGCEPFAFGCPRYRRGGGGYHQRPGGYALTEFYLLGPDGLAERYPGEARVGQAVAVTVGIANQERAAGIYRVEVRIEEQQVGSAGPITLGVQEVWEQAVSFTPSQAGPHQEVRFLLFREGYSQPYRSLRLWLDIQ